MTTNALPSSGTPHTLHTLRTLQQQFISARDVATPIVAIRTFDAMSAIKLIAEAVQDAEGIRPILLWDCVRGYTAVNEEAKQTIADMANALGVPEEALVNPDIALKGAAMLGDKPEAVLFFANMHLIWSQPAMIQGIWNLRDVYKRERNTAVILCLPGSTLPQELAQDVYVIDESLPTSDEIQSLAYQIYDDAGVSRPTADVMTRIQDALIGLPVFPSEQALSLCIDPQAGTLDIAELWHRKRETINGTPGLTFHEPKEGFDSIGGLNSIKSLLTSLFNGQNPPRVIVFTDEIEKGIAGTGTESSGTKTELVGELLQVTTNNDWDGIALLGVQGSGKTAIAMATAFQFGVPCIGLNIAAMQDKHVGESTARMRQALATITAISGGKVLWLATSNNFEALPSELRDRFQFGQFFFDLPTHEERSSIWSLYIAKYRPNTAGGIPHDDGWNGRSIRECVKKAARMEITLKDAAQYVIPVSVSAADTVTRLRATSKGRYLSASYKGHYNGTDTPTVPQIADSGDSVNAVGRRFRKTEDKAN